VFDWIEQYHIVAVQQPRIPLDQHDELALDSLVGLEVGPRGKAASGNVSR